MARQGHRLGGGEPPELADAKRASVRVVDEFGRDDRRNSDVCKLVHEREAEQRLTIVTTWMNQAEVASNYDGGIARRLFEGALVIRLGARRDRSTSTAGRSAFTRRSTESQAARSRPRPRRCAICSSSRTYDLSFSSSAPRRKGRGESSPVTRTRRSSQAAFETT
jgi:hypothetical protein